MTTPTPNRVNLTSSYPSSIPPRDNLSIPNTVTDPATLPLPLDLRFTLSTRHVRDSPPPPIPIFLGGPFNDVSPASDPVFPRLKKLRKKKIKAAKKARQRQLLQYFRTYHRS